MQNQPRHWPIWLTCTTILLVVLGVEWLRGLLLFGVVLVCILQLWPRRNGGSS